jgi:processive 1,2-diacylglycerol beta-glucosyltransferase
LNRPHDPSPPPHPCAACTEFPRDPETREAILRRFAAKIVSSIRPSSVIDFSVPAFPLADALRAQGAEACRERGADTRSISCQDPPPVARHTDSGSGSLREAGCGPFDLATCVGLPQGPGLGSLARILPDLANRSHKILFSACPFGSENASCRRSVPAECVLSLFENLGYSLEVPVSRSLDLPNTFLFRKRSHRAARPSRPLRLFVLSPFASHACSELRLIGPIRHLQQENRVEMRFFPADRKHPPAMEHLDWADMVLLQRVKSRAWRPYLIRARKKRKPVIYDLDDDVLDLPPDHPDFRSPFRHRRQRAKYEWFLARADAITVSTRALDPRMRKFGDQVYLIRNYIDSRMGLPSFRPEEPAPRDPPAVWTLGYAGTRTHASDFQPLVGPLKQIGSDPAGRVRMVFLGFMPAELTGQPHLSFDNRYLFYEQYLRELGRSGIQIGLAPLRDDAFNRCKSHIKFLEYALAGIPGVYSDVGPYRDTVVDSCTGLLVSDHTAGAWLDRLRQAMASPELLPEIRKNAVEFLRRYFLLKDHYLEWWDTYQEVLTHVGGKRSEGG